MIVSGDILHETVARALLTTVMDSLPANLTAVALESAAEDAEFFGGLNQPVPETPLPPPNLYELGHFPSAMERPLEDYPMIIVQCFRKANGELGPDQYDSSTYSAYVEGFFTHPSESTINRIAWRYAKAAHRGIMQHKDIGEEGLAIVPIETSPEVLVSNSTARRVSEFVEDAVYVQGFHIEYAFRVEVPDVW